MRGRLFSLGMPARRLSCRRIVSECWHLQKAATLLASIVAISLGLRIYFCTNVSEHADGERRRSVSMRTHLKMRLTETFPMPPSAST